MENRFVFIPPPPLLLPLPPPPQHRHHQEHRLDLHLHRQETRALQASYQVAPRTTWEVWLDGLLSVNTVRIFPNQTYTLLSPSTRPSSPSKISPAAQRRGRPSLPRIVSACHRMSVCPYVARTWSTFGSWEDICQSELCKRTVLVMDQF